MPKTHLGHWFIWHNLEIQLQKEPKLEHWIHGNYIDLLVWRQLMWSILIVLRIILHMWPISVRTIDFGAFLHT